MNRFTAVWIGDGSRAEFAAVRAWLDDCPDLTWTSLANVRELIEQCPRVDLVVIGESWPDEFSAQDVSQIIATVPLARVVCVTGLWSEAVGRTRSAWPPAWRVPLWESISRLERELNGLRACQSHSTSPAAAFLPWTASRQETWLWQHNDATSPAPSGTGRTVSLDEIADASLAAWLSTWLTANGFCIDHNHAEIVLCDADPWSVLVREHLITVKQRWPSARIVALTAWRTPALEAELAVLAIPDIADKLAPDSLLRVLSIPHHEKHQKTPL